MKTIRQLLKQPGFFNVNPARIKPMPFAGKYPTRWGVAFFKGQNLEKEIYLMKPNGMTPRIVRKKSQIWDGTLCLCEFDRGGVIRFLMRPTPRTSFSVQSCHALLCGVYYPWHQTAGDFFQPWYFPVFYKRMMFRNHSWNIYCPYEQMNTPEFTQKLRDYRSWLSKQNPWK